jgi:hypothetical protein
MRKRGSVSAAAAAASRIMKSLSILIAGPRNATA